MNVKQTLVMTLLAISVSLNADQAEETSMIASFNWAVSQSNGGSYGEPEKMFEVIDYSHLIGMPGFSDKALKAHFKLYAGYVKNTNLLLQQFRKMIEEGELSGPVFNELNRRFGWEFDGMRLHELYFENLGGNGELDKNQTLYRLIARDFGSFENWKKDFKATGLIRGIGWVILYQDPRTGRLMNVWINEHDTGHLSGTNPILVMDVWEHAYLFDYALDRDAYIDNFIKNIKWSESLKRFH
ncbi:MAG: superoxide dismutase [Waddliaceae bacterium]